jgi:diguanylate cyclase
MDIAGRLKGNFQLTMLMVLAGCSVLGISPFVVLRLATGEPGKALLNLGIVLAICAAPAYAWRTGRVQRAAVAMGLVNTLCCLVVSLVFDRQALLWSYLAIVTNFILLDRRGAMGLSLVLVAGLLAQVGMFESVIEMTSYAVTTLLLSIYSYASAYRNELQQARLASLATRDPLTGAGNRRLMEEDLNAAIAANQREPTPMTLGILDIDHFKSVNDLHGHEAGDRVLKTLVEAVQRTLRRSDRIYRFGGEEFVVVLPGAGPRDGVRILEGVHEALRRELCSPGGPVSVSIGASMLESGEDWTAWLGRADAALYRAKRGGRARLVFDDLPVPGNGSISTRALDAGTLARND